MNRDGHLPLPIEVLEEIDRRRSRVSRSEYVCYLLEKHRDVEPAYVTREEFEENQERMRSLLRNFLEFVIAFGLDLGLPRGDPKKLLARLRVNGHRNGKLEPT